MDTWQAVAQFGLPTVLLIILLYYFQRAGTFLGTSVIVPLAVRMIDYSKSQEVFMSRQTIAIEKQAETLQALEVTTSKIGGTQAEIVKVVNKISDTQDDQAKRPAEGRPG